MPEGVDPLVGYIEELVDEMPAYLENVPKRKGRVSDGADEYSLHGRWDITSLDAATHKLLHKSEPVLSGGQALLRVALAHHAALHQPKDLERYTRKNAATTQRTEQRRTRRALNPRLPSSHRRRLPEGLRVL